MRENVTKKKYKKSSSVGKIRFKDKSAFAALISTGTQFSFPVMSRWRYLWNKNGWDYSELDRLWNEQIRNVANRGLMLWGDNGIPQVETVNTSLTDIASDQTTQISLSVWELEVVWVGGLCRAAWLFIWLPDWDRLVRHQSKSEGCVLNNAL